jgi:HTH-type transcriptional regulator/antitoxin HigA
VLKARVFHFFRINSIDESPRLSHAAKQHDVAAALSPIQLAWIFRVNQIAKALPVSKFSETKFLAAIGELRALLLSPEEIRHIPRILADCGVRFIVVEPMPSSKIDGVCLWLEGRPDSPVIAMTLRYDRIDNFWFVFRHEADHVLNRHGLRVQHESYILDEQVGEGEGRIPAEESDANKAAAEFCVPKAEMDDFISRVQPFLSEQKVLGFSKRIQVHPGLVVGQLHRRLKRYDLFKKYQVKVRDIITNTALTDGYGRPGPVNL